MIGPGWLQPSREYKPDQHGMVTDIAHDNSMPAQSL